MARIYVRNAKIKFIKRPHCYSQCSSFFVAIILRLNRRKKNTKRININTAKQAMPAEIPAALFFLPAYTKH